VAIQGFGSTVVEVFFVSGKLPKKGAGWRQTKDVTKRKLDMVDYAAALEDLRSPPANRLEPLHGNLEGFHSIRINDQWRVIFRWTDAGPADVDIVDYH